jgi:hypothetical protein
MLNEVYSVFQDEIEKLKYYNIIIMIAFFTVIFSIIFAIFFNETYSKYKEIKDNKDIFKNIK